MTSMTGKRAMTLLVALASSIGFVSCGGSTGDPGSRVVATVGGDEVTVAQVQAYLEVNLVIDPTAEPIPPRDLARVKSRLFDDYLDGEILAHEARKRGLTVSDDELAEYLRGDTSPSPSARELARRDLLIQKLRESVVRAEAHIEPASIDAWLMTHPQHGSELPGRLRTLRFASYPEAMRVRDEIVSKKLSFEQAHDAYGADALTDTTGEPDLGALPSHIATAVKGLAPGQVSQPLPFETSVLLFLLQPPEDPGAAEARRRDEARQALALEKSQEIADRLLDQLRKSTTVVRHDRELSFPYVAESKASRPE
jgi:hypothetical protein